MSENRYSIDFEILWKRIHGTLSEQEKMEFEQWLIEEKSHLQFFRRVEDFYRNGSAYDNRPPETGSLWLELEKNISRQVSRGNPRHIVYKLPVAVAILLLAGIFILKPQNETPRTGTTVNEVFEPGSERATLTLGDGSAYQLETQQEWTIQTEDAHIRSSGNTVEFTATDSKPVSMQYNRLVVPKGGEFFLSLSDGTRIWLNSCTSVIFPDQFSVSERSIELQGEAFFEVAEDPSRPFRIVTGDQVLEVIGTTFNLSSYPEDSLVRTTLVSGMIRLSRKSDTTVTRLLDPSHQGMVDRAAGTFSSHRVDVGPYISWKDGWFRFEDQPLDEMMLTLSRWYDFDPVFINPEAREVRFTGSIRRYDNLDEILSIIEKTREVTFQIDHRKINIYWP